MAEMRYSLVAYLEILTPTGEPDEGTWVAISERIRGLLDEPGARSSANERRSLQLGNRLVFVQPLDIQDDRRTPREFLLELLLRLAALQMILPDLGVFFRGAISHGHALSGTDTIVGHAVRAAQQHARYERMPRIIVDHGLRKAIAHNPRLRGDAPQKMRARLESLLAQDSDGLWFVDYMAVLKPMLEFRDLLGVQARVIEQVLEHIHARGEDPRPWLWLATYHERVVASLEDIDEATRDSLRISSDTPLRFRF